MLPGDGMGRPVMRQVTPGKEFDIVSVAHGRVRYDRVVVKAVETGQQLLDRARGIVTAQHAEGAARSAANSGPGLGVLQARASKLRLTGQEPERWLKTVDGLSEPQQTPSRAASAQRGETNEQDSLPATPAGAPGGAQMTTARRRSVSWARPVGETYVESPLRKRRDRSVTPEQSEPKRANVDAGAVDIDLTAPREAQRGDESMPAIDGDSSGASSSGREPRQDERAAEAPETSDSDGASSSSPPPPRRARSQTTAERAKVDASKAAAAAARVGDLGRIKRAQPFSDCARNIFCGPVDSKAAAERMCDSDCHKCSGAQFSCPDRTCAHHGARFNNLRELAQHCAAHCSTVQTEIMKTRPALKKCSVCSGIMAGPGIAHDLCSVTAPFKFQKGETDEEADQRFQSEVMGDFTTTPIDEFGAMITPAVLKFAKIATITNPDMSPSLKGWVRLGVS